MADEEQLVRAIVAGDTRAVSELVSRQPELASARHPDGDRSMLHHATDWPGHRPNVAATIGLLIAAGAVPNVTFPHPTNPEVAETPLHWAVSSDDVPAATALLDAGANVDAFGGIFDGCTPYVEAIIFEKYDAARLLLERGAQDNLPGAAALGDAMAVDGFIAADGTLTREARIYLHLDELPPADMVLDRSMQFACRAGHLQIAQRLVDLGADVNSISPADTTALDMATENEHAEVVDWLRQLGATTA